MSLLERDFSKELVTFSITNTAEVEPAIVESAQRAVSMVWEHHVGGPTTMNVTFVDRITGHGYIDHNGLPIDVPARYVSTSDTIEFGIDRINELTAEFPNMRLRHWIPLIGGHEAMHRVQIHRGHMLPDTHKILAEGRHADSLHEIEANIEGLHVLKAMHPHLRERFLFGRYTYSVPEVSKYPSRYSNGSVDVREPSNLVPVFRAPRFRR